MASSDDDTLGRRLLATLEDVTTLIERAPAGEDVSGLMTQRKRLLKEIERLVEANLDRASREYREATQALRAASATIERALQSLDRVADAVTALARALDLAAKVAGA